MLRFRILGTLLAAVLSALLITAPVAAAGSGYRSLTPPTELKNLQGVTLRVPMGESLPPDTELWTMVMAAQGVQQGQLSKRIQPTFTCCIPLPANWYTESSSYGGHSSWLLGSTLTNFTNQPAQQTFTMTGTVTAGFSGSLSAKNVVSGSLNLSASVSLSISTQYTIPSQMAAALWGSAWGTTHVGVVHYATLWWNPLTNTYTYQAGGTENVSSFIPSAPNFSLTNFCPGCYPTPPAS